MHTTEFNSTMSHIILFYTKPSSGFCFRWNNFEENEDYSKNDNNFAAYA